MTELRRSLLEALPATADAITLDLPADLDQAALVNRLLKTYEGPRPGRGQRRRRAGLVADRARRPAPPRPGPGTHTCLDPGSATGRAASEGRAQRRGETRDATSSAPDPRRGLRVEWQPRGDGDPSSLAESVGQSTVAGSQRSTTATASPPRPGSTATHRRPPSPCALGAWLAQGGDHARRLARARALAAPRPPRGPRQRRRR